MNSKLPNASCLFARSERCNFPTCSTLQATCLWSHGETHAEYTSRNALSAKCCNNRGPYAQAWVHHNRKQGGIVAPCPSLRDSDGEQHPRVCVASTPASLHKDAHSRCTQHSVSIYETSTHASPQSLCKIFAAWLTTSSGGVVAPVALTLM